MAVDGDRRRFMREPCLISAYLRVGSRIHEGTLVNISNNGGYFASKRPVEPGSRVQLRFRHPWTEETVTARGIVMRSIGAGSREGPQPGLGIALLDSLSDLEDEPDPTSGTFSVPVAQEVERLTAQARARTAARLKAASRPGSKVGIPAVSGTGSHPKVKAHQMRQARYKTDRLTVNFYGAGRRDSVGLLSDISVGGLHVLTRDPPEMNRLVRLEILDEGRPSLKIAGKVTWSEPEDTPERKAGFGIRILHFLSADDEKRWDGFLEAMRARSTSGAYAQPG